MTRRMKGGVPLPGCLTTQLVSAYRAALGSGHRIWSLHLKGQMERITITCPASTHQGECFALQMATHLALFSTHSIPANMQQELHRRVRLSACHASLSALLACN